MCMFMFSLHALSGLLLTHDFTFLTACTQAIAERAVNDAFVKCYNDEMPFSADKKRAVFAKK